jgi:hypothetical protein
MIKWGIIGFGDVCEKRAGLYFMNVIIQLYMR